MENFITIKDDTGFPANMNNFISTADDYKYFEGSSEKFSGLEIIKNQFFIVEEQQNPLELSVQSFLNPIS